MSQSDHKSTEKMEFPEGSRFLPIYPGSKYILVFPPDADEDRVKLAMEQLEDFMQDPYQVFLAVGGDVKLLKLREVDLSSE